jgi:hypothetical protein
MRFLGSAAGAAAIAAAFAVTVSTSSVAAPLPNLTLLKDNISAQTQIEKAHFWHRKCRRGLNGWHRHVKGVGRVQCTSMRCWKNSWGRRVCRPVG